MNSHVYRQSQCYTANNIAETPHLFDTSILVASCRKVFFSDEYLLEKLNQI